MATTHVTTERVMHWCRAVLALEPEVTQRSLSDYLAAIPRLDSLEDVPAGSTVLVRGDVDAKPGGEVGQGDVRLRSMLDTLRFGHQRGWKQVIIGHVGRDPEKSLNKVASRLAQLLECDVPLVDNWWDESTQSIPPSVSERIRLSPPGSVLVLENARRYEIERCLWDANADKLAGLVPQLACLANEFANKIADVYVNEALSAGSLDTSSTILPAAMHRVALGRYVASELDGPVQKCLGAQLVIFSGLKADKLDDLQSMIQRGKIRMVISAGSLAMALIKGAANVEGKDCCLGVAEDPAHAKQPYFVSAERIQQAERMIRQGRVEGIEFVLPIDFVLHDERVVETLEPKDQQLDVGPKTRQLFAQKVGEFIKKFADWPEEPAVAFHNGVFGKFEDPRFERGTRDFIGQLKRMTDAGVRVYVGGGEGGTALEKYGQPDWVTHCFTAGGTILSALGGQPIPYLVALWLAAQQPLPAA